MSLGAIVNPHAATSKQGAAAASKYLGVTELLGKMEKKLIYFLTALRDKVLHLGLKDSQFAFHKWSKHE